MWAARAADFSLLRSSLWMQEGLLGSHCQCLGVAGPLRDALLMKCNGNSALWRRSQIPSSLLWQKRPLKGLIIACFLWVVVWYGTFVHCSCLATFDFANSSSQKSCGTWADHWNASDFNSYLLKDRTAFPVTLKLSLPPSLLLCLSLSPSLCLSLLSKIFDPEIIK